MIENCRIVSASDKSYFVRLGRVETAHAIAVRDSLIASPGTLSDLRIEGDEWPGFWRRLLRRLRG